MPWHSMTGEAELHRIQFTVNAAFFEKFFVASLLNNLPFVHDHNPIRLLDR